MAKGTKEKFDYKECKICGSMTICQFPQNINEYYENYYSFSKSFSNLHHSLLKQMIAWIFKWAFVRTHILRLIKRYIKEPPIILMNHLHWNMQAILYLCPKYNDHILDVGSGFGELVSILHKFGYINACGIDPYLPSDREAPFIKQRKIQELSTLRLFDIVMFNHSFEHVDDPENHIRCAAALTRQGGTVIIHIPNLNSLDRIKFKEYWWPYHAPFHYSIPTQRGLEVMAARHGLKMIDAIGTSRWDHYLYSQEYVEGIGDYDPRSVRRLIEQGHFDKNKHWELQKKARFLNTNKTGELISYYFIKK